MRSDIAIDRLRSPEGPGPHPETKDRRRDVNPLGAKKKGAAHSGSPPPTLFGVKRLALRELEAAASLGAAVLLTLDGTAVAGQEALGLDRTAQGRLILAERLRDTVLDRAGLAGEAAALDGADDIILA